MEDLEFAKHIFERMGKCIVVEEKLLNVVTALSGSGPAYVYELIDAMISGGIELGLSEENARFLAVNTVLGAAKVADKKNESMQELCNKVKSSKGTTEAACNLLHEYGWKETLISAMKAAHKRSEELSI